MSEKLKMLRAELKIRQRQYNAASLALARVNDDIEYLEKRDALARAEPNTDISKRARSAKAAGR